VYEIITGKKPADSLEDAKKGKVNLFEKNGYSDQLKNLIYLMLSEVFLYFYNLIDLII
jgi:hypothetical protein